MIFRLKNRKNRKALIFILGLLSFAIFFYILILPFYPEVKYRLSNKDIDQKVETEKIVEEFKKNNEIITEVTTGFPKSEYKTSPDRLIISKIGVNAPIVETDNEAYGLSLGAWLMPTGARPGEIGNTIITGHRFKYLPPNNLTFYLFHKLEIGDLVYIVWKGEEMYYEIDDIKVVEDTDLSVIDPSDDEILTMFTCTPIYSTKQRLVVTAKPIEK
ncbi:MAG: sortase [Patescibacteria group bacterium]|jgi:LPXTG-site transpeptidase (sortase) family protein|nr:sortase [Patescibacteria group bacterium]